MLMENYAFIFDIGRVLLDFDSARAARRLAAVSPLSPEEMMARMWGSSEGCRLADEYELGHISSAEFFRGVRPLLELRIDYEEFADIWADIFTENEDIKKLLVRLAPYPKAICSNTCALHWERGLADTYLRDHFRAEDIIKSYEVGLRKPDARIYELTKAQLPADASILYFDDIEAYTQAASKLGIRGIKYDCRTDDLDEVLEKNGIEV